MSGTGTNNNSSGPFWPTRRSLHDHGGYAPPNTNNDSNHIEDAFRPSGSFTSTAAVRWFEDALNNRASSSREPWQMAEERTIPRRPYSFSGFPDHQDTPNPVQIVWLNHMPARAANPRFSGPLPSFRFQQDVQNLPAIPTQQDEQNNVLSKLKKEIYNPAPKRMTRRLSSFYRDQNRSSNYNEKEKDTEDDGKRCAICLEDFEPKEQVMLTPCDHMFHEECILPWVKSHGQCPVCRYVLSERNRQTTSSPLSNNNNNNNNLPYVAAPDLFAGELISIIRAMEEAFLWGNSL